MPDALHFPHHRYEEGPQIARAELLRAPSPVESGGAEFDRQLQRVGERLRRANVAAIYLVHGTFVGEDVFGWLSELARVWPTAADLLRHLQKHAIDSVMKDVANYTDAFAAEFGKTGIPTRLFHWSGENHHLGRADGAIRLLDDLAQQDLPAGSRVMLWGHSHGGNVFALVSNLLAASAPLREAFFQAASPFFRVPVLGSIDIPVWPAVEQRLADPHDPLRQLTLDFVTFGTPIRYGWNLAGAGKLLHWVHHRPTMGLPPHRVPFPPTVDDILHARHGDYVQTFGIAGTNFFPNLLSARAMIAELRLTKFLQPGIRRRELLERLKVGLRVPEDGHVLLCDYGPIIGSIAEHVAGHAIYTLTDRLPFHAEETTRRLYDSTVP